MIDFEKELALILKNDPLGLLNVKPKASSIISTDERLIASFEEINSFIEEFKHEPAASRNIKERRLYSRLKGLRENPEKMLALEEIDRFDLFPKNSFSDAKKETKEFKPDSINTIGDILEDDALGLLGDVENNSEQSNPNDIFTIKNIPKTIEMPEKVARRKPCQDFDQFELLFKQCHMELQTGEREIRKFSGEQQISSGHFFILHGVMLYVASVGAKTKKNKKVNAKLRCIFENGTESDMLLRSLARELYKDETGRRVLDISDTTNETDLVTNEDQATGTIYVLRSLSVPFRTIL